MEATPFKNEKEASDPSLFKIKKEKSNLAFYNDNKNGPSFGLMELTTLLSTDDDPNRMHATGMFDGLYGNRLCGGYNYNSLNLRYSFKIEKMNTFTISIKD